ncbi:hemolysin family protein [Pontivivens ytuae]|uniref:HlyC/CorC family transporter n=1 Tax=Pontivivens ytuae TaxID=2789856 RepID=A0A7S9LTY7_9RHOB|nr:hemolysin family protein [Pontivivens ytuae]QPH55214.1 HlyC/CorC family transporter [Pontivivens ytuae]
MTDSPEGPSTAAQGAPTGTKPQRRLPFLTRLFRRTAPETDTEPAQQSAMEAASEAGAREMLLNLRKMRDLRVADVAVPRADIVALPADAPLDEIMAAYRESGFTRLPVYNETLDDPLGFLHLKDIALRYGFGAEDGTEDLSSLHRRILFVPPSMPLGALLQRMQNTRIHMALVIDEYGGVDGLVTIEDLLEEIVGEIEDEHDIEEARMWRVEAPGVYVANARAELPDFEQAAGVDLLADDLDEEVDTLGGLVFMLSGRVPERAEVICHPDGHEFEVIDADARRIKRLRVRIGGAVAEQAAAE